MHPENAKNARGPTVVLGVIGADCHSVGNRILDSFFCEKGFNVVNLGVMVSQKDFIRAAVREKAAAILVSSLYGHGEIDCLGFREQCVREGIGGILLYVGGNLVVGKYDRREVEKKFREMGFDRVFFPDSDLAEAAEALRKDIAARAASAGTAGRTGRRKQKKSEE